MGIFFLTSKMEGLYTRQNQAGPAYASDHRIIASALLADAAFHGFISPHPLEIGNCP